MNAFGAMADRYRVRVREEMTVLPPGADAQELRSIVAARLRDLLERDRVILPSSTWSVWWRRSSTTRSGWARSSR